MKFKIKQKKQPISFSLREDGVTQSLLTDWRKCPTKARLIMQGYYKPGASLPIIFGNVFHRCLDYSYRYINESSDFDVIQSLEYRMVILNDVSNYYLDEYNAANADGKDHFNFCYNIVPAMVQKYFRYWREDLEEKKFIEVEKVFSVSYWGTDINIKGKRDGIFQELENYLKLIEHKTKGQIPQDALSMIIERDLQVLLYIWTYYAETGNFLKGVLYNIIRRPMLRKKQVETIDMFHKRILDDVDNKPEHYFLRYDVPISKKSIIRFGRKIDHELSKFYDWFKEDPKFDAQHTHECNSVFGKCPFLELCDSGMTDFSMLDIRKSHHPELR